MVTFLKSVFDADGEMRAGAPAELRIGGSMILVSDGGGVREALSTFLYVYVEATDKIYQRAINAGALVIEEPADMPYGDRRGTVPMGQNLADRDARTSNSTIYERVGRLLTGPTRAISK